ncbi:MAG: hypothetical protein WB791_05075 [Waddliaceae bacterium]
MFEAVNRYLNPFKGLFLSPDGPGDAPNSQCIRVQHYAREFFERLYSIYKRNYIGDIGSILKRALKIRVLTKPKLQAQWGNWVPRLGLLRGISCCEAIASIPKAYRKWEDSRKFQHVVKDTEGVFFATLSLCLVPADVLDSFATTWQSLNQLGLFSKIGILNRLSLLAAVGLLSALSIKEGYLVFRQYCFLHGLATEVTEENYAQLLKTFEEMDLTPAERGENLNERKITILSDRKRNMLERVSDEKVVTLMKNLQEDIKERENWDTVNKGLKDMRTLMVRKMWIGANNALWNGALAATLAAESVLSGVFIQSVLLIRTSIFLVRKLCLAYEMHLSGLSLEPKYFKKNMGARAEPS